MNLSAPVARSPDWSGGMDPRKNNFPDWQAATARREEEEFSRKGAKSAEKGMGIDLRHVRT